ncbi:MAG: hypothetical protein RI947_1586 [Candidatus Parcubacteria bacterium]|jgi:hypothetical protein
MTILNSVQFLIEGRKKRSLIIEHNKFYIMEWR